MRGSRKFCQRGTTSTFFFDEGRKDSNTTIKGPSTARQRNAIQMAFRWWADGGPTLNAFYEGRKDSNITIKGPSTARQRNAIQMVFRWRADGGPTLNACSSCKLCGFTGDPD